MVLADHLGKPVRTQPVGERARRIALQARRRKQARSVGFRAPTHPPNTAEISWPPRRMVSRHSRAGWPVTRSRSFMVAIFSLLTLTTMSPFWNPKLWATEPFSTSVTATPSAAVSSRNSSASAGDRLASLRPEQGRARLDHGLLARRFRRRLQRDRDLDLAPAPHDAELRLAAHRLGGEAIVEGVGIVDRLSVHFDDEIAGAQARARRRAARGDGVDQRSGRPLQAEAVGDVRRHRLQLGAEPRPAHHGGAAPGRRDHRPHHVRRDRKADALRTAGAREDRGVDADQAAGKIDQRAAGIAGIDRGVGLDEELVVGDPDLGAGHRRHDAVGDGLADAERIADGEHHVADLQRVGIAEIGRGEALAAVLDAQHGEIGARILEDEIGVEFALVGESDLDLVRILDDVIVGDDEAGGVDDDAGAQRALDLLARAAGAAAKEAAEDRIVEQRHPVFDDPGGVDVDHRRRDALDHRRKAQPDLAGRLRHADVLGRRARDEHRQQRKGQQQTRYHGHGANPRGVMARDIKRAAPDLKVGGTGAGRGA